MSSLSEAWSKTAAEHRVNARVLLFGRPRGELSDLLRREVESEEGRAFVYDMAAVLVQGDDFPRCLRAVVRGVSLVCSHEQAPGESCRCVSLAGLVEQLVAQVPQ